MFLGVLVTVGANYQDQFFTYLQTVLVTKSAIIKVVLNTSSVSKVPLKSYLHVCSRREGCQKTSYYMKLISHMHNLKNVYQGFCIMYSSFGLFNCVKYAWPTMMALKKRTWAPFRICKNCLEKKQSNNGSKNATG